MRLLAISCLFLLSSRMLQAASCCFGVYGYVDIKFGESFGSSGQILVQADEKILVAGHSYEDGLSVIRLLCDGSLDSAFGISGTASLPSIWAGGAKIAIQSDGKILLTGNAGYGNGVTPISAARFNPDGSLDTGFGSSGIAFVPLGGANEGWSEVESQSDGKVLLIGQSDAGGAAGSYLMRLDASGALDSTFASSGILNFTASLGSGFSAGSIEVQPDGKILAGGRFDPVSGDSEALVVRLNSNGTLDPSFGIAGIVTKNFGPGISAGTGIDLQGDGKIMLLAGTWGAVEGAAFARIDSSGSFDPSYASGTPVLDALGNSIYMYSSGLLPDGTLLATGSALDASSQDTFRVVRYLVNGAKDLAFGSMGSLDLDFNHQYQGGTGVCLLPDGKALIACQFSQMVGYPTQGVYKMKADGSGEVACMTATPSPTSTPVTDSLIFDSDLPANWIPMGDCASFQPDDATQNHGAGGSESGSDATGMHACIASNVVLQLSAYGALEFWILPTGPGLDKVSIALLGSLYPAAPEAVFDVTSVMVGGWQAGMWNKVEVPMSYFSTASTSFWGIRIDTYFSGPSSACYLDDAWLRLGVPATMTPSSSATHTETPLATPSSTPTQTPSATPTQTPNFSFTQSSSATSTPSITQTPCGSCPTAVAVLNLPSGSTVQALPSSNPVAANPANPVAIYVSAAGYPSGQFPAAAIYSSSGAQLATLPCLVCQGPTLTFKWDGTDGSTQVANGIYFFMVDLGSYGKKYTPIYVLN